jgi:glycerol kinase
MAGLAFGTRKEHLARAALESIAFQVEDVVAEVEREVGAVPTILADGGATSNDVLMQLQADTSGRCVQRALAKDLSALGAAHMAGLAAGVWSLGDLTAMERQRQAFASQQDDHVRHRRQDGWRDAVARSRAQFETTPR